MSTPKFSLYDGLICKHCTRLFSLGRADQLINGLQFPKHDFSIITAKCPRCFSQRTYGENDILRSNNDEQESEELKNLRNELAQTRVERDTIKKLYEELLVKFADIIHNSQQPQKPTDSQMQPVG
ncbi:MAG: hypothetical protein KGI19_07455 [Thaumarchaeota archaeon]|nr:hypothetical protein [Nitrososphaerota archaeon]MDE1818423.1 hypothetical protein [Nitrososphaerota archaeon]